MPKPLVTFIHISDTHIHRDMTYVKNNPPLNPDTGAAALVDQINNLPFALDFVLHTGDVAYDPDPDVYPICKEILGKIKYPVFYVAGNHDDDAALQKYLLGRDNPIKPLHYELDVNGVQVVGVDSNGPVEQPRGFMTDTQLEWLSAVCRAPDYRPLIIALHHNPLPVDIPWLDGYMGITNAEAFHDAILPARHRLRGVFFGHIHQHLDMYRDGILYCGTASSWYQLHAYPGLETTSFDVGAEPGFSLVMVAANQTYVRRYRYPLPKPSPLPEESDVTRQRKPADQVG
jgi:Icc protein